MGDYNRIEGVLVVPTKFGDVRMQRQVTPVVKAKIEDWLELSARRRTAHLRRQLGEAAYVEAMNSVTMLSAAGKLQWGGEAWRMAMGDAAGQIELIVALAHEAGQLDLAHETVVSVMNDPADGAVLAEALKQIMENNPNFLQRPARDPTS